MPILPLFAPAKRQSFQWWVKLRALVRTDGSVAGWHGGQLS